jgi:hypothetical protein
LAAPIVKLPKASAVAGTATRKEAVSLCLWLHWALCAALGALAVVIVALSLTVFLFYPVPLLVFFSCVFLHVRDEGDDHGQARDTKERKALILLKGKT